MIKPIKLRFYETVKFDDKYFDGKKFRYEYVSESIDAKLGLVVGENFLTLNKGVQKYRILKRNPEKPIYFDDSEYEKIEIGKTYAYNEVDFRGYCIRKQINKNR